MSHGPSQSGRRSPRRGGPGRGGPMGAMMKGDKASDFKGTMKKLIRYLGRYKIVIIIAILIAVGSTAASIAGPKILGRATTTLFEGLVETIRGTGVVDFDAIKKFIFITLALYIGSGILSYIQGWIMARVSTNIA
ncbi:MAG: ABC transporter ATP-binding protein, partial [Candidatus Heimdallarchaeota archaeon]|nr:ABC transporter ATP-binding protein [Candidatus Heimdallarchaeota archaeon]MCK4878335.1 ABC transporter ATP-binding protein [Candidatus Heimdallarchaeota archaeon]